MEKVVAKRTLKKSYYKNNNLNYTLDNINNIEKKEEKLIKEKANFKERILFKLALQTITVISILFFVLSVKFLNISVVKNSDISKKIIKEYKKTYSIKNIEKKGIEIAKKSYVFVKPIVPDKIKEITKNTYVKLKKTVINKNKEQEVNIYEEVSNNKSEDKEKAIGNSLEDEEKVVTVSSSISSEISISEKIKNTGVKFVKPLSGVITSRFGAREAIFEGVDSYHTGIDIATDTGKEIVSSTDGIVTVATNNKYNGNYVEVTNGKIITKYCHMSKITVKKGSKIKAGEKVGEVGSTGLATGPHLHFEVVYDGTKINPELVLSFK